MSAKLVVMRTAIFSPCRAYRYGLFRIWNTGGEQYAFIGLNPSTATMLDDDPTVRRCVNFVKAWGGGGLIMLNAFGLRATEPQNMKTHPDPVGPDNDRVILEAAEVVRNTRGKMIAAWGVHGGHLGRDEEIREMIGVPLYALGLTKAGHPKHPLYLRADLTPEIWHVAV